MLTRRTLTSLPSTAGTRQGRVTRTLRLLLALLVLAAVSKASVARLDAPEEQTHLEASSASQAWGSGWWSEHKKRFHELALCALAGADVTFVLLAGVSGVGAGIGVAAAALTVLMCL